MSAYARGGRRLGPTATVAALLAASTASAQPAYPSWVFFGSAEGGTSGFASAGFKRGLTGGLYEPGLFLQGSLGSGNYSYRSRVVEGGRATGRVLGASLMPGAQWSAGNTTFGFFVGPEIERHWLTPPDPDNRARGTRWGLRGQIDIWSHPTPRTLVTATLIGGTAAPHLWSRLSAGYRLFEAFYFGPEASAYASPDYRELRLGLHATGLTLRGLTFRLSGGLRIDSDDRTGAYAGLTTHASY
ncbi:cellulose biosynthesis protein BcsS [Chelatococcus sp. SYSU_G07232]|uniref:Cellulose biosynthesis protein BcsS n=1 Tax=Chelatococcus albus TaxID=3047466 RepID=A0ABT7AGA3_9HYPH|nr:cellulose biosynthesis protein BcsS [Chelatococcus sp. SYSU_G07232]MDJ1158386.1 cellulose biosynthesis protein BcsS [Chelatococcus sp. SYSU_G07232]